mmetsp:Transcript_32216/g.102696  ORF Transcript_32216/g.102696 Transcript_32216/m.102696 type:complete len:367 (+) Transcript_32216:172-1272(+)
MGNVNATTSSARRESRVSTSTTTTRSLDSGTSGSSSSSWFTGGKGSEEAWDERTIGQLLSEGKVAPRGGAREGSIECPICFCTFDAVNYASCCSQPICTDCYLQIRPPSRGSKGVATCPFCGRDDFSASTDAKKADRWDARTDELHFAVDEAFDDDGAASASVQAAAPPPALSGSSSFGSSSSTKKKTPPTTKVSSAEERSRIESDMRRQLEESRRRGDSPAAPPPARPATLAGLGVSLGSAHRRRARARAARLAAENGNLTFEDIHALLDALPTDLHQVEELMVLEAMQASLEEEEQRRQRQADQEQDQDIQDQDQDRDASAETERDGGDGGDGAADRGTTDDRVDAAAADDPQEAKDSDDDDDD